MATSPQRLILSVLALGGVLAVPATVASAGRTSPPDTTADAAATKRVSVLNNQFSPRKVSIGRRSTVTWIWRDGGVRHNVRPRRGRGSRTTSRKGFRFSHTFRRRGTFRYTCTIHPDSMRIAVQVR